MRRRGELTDAQWERRKPLLPPEQPKTGCPAPSYRTLLNGILWGLRAEGAGKPLAIGLMPARATNPRFARHGSQAAGSSGPDAGDPTPPSSAPRGERQGLQQRRDPGLRHRHNGRIPLPRKRHETRTGPFDRALYRQRNGVERLVNRFKPFRRLATPLREAGGETTERGGRLRPSGFGCAFADAS